MTKIVQCPSCNTKFALNESQLAGVETPKFQCSRCQTIFNLTEEKDRAEAISGKWDLGNNTPSTDERDKVEEDPHLKDFSINLGKFSIDAEKSITGISTTKDSPEITQLDFGFSKPKISPQLSQEPQHSATQVQLEKQHANTSQKDAPTKVNNRFDSNTLDNVIYGESGQKDSSISVDWDADETKEAHHAEEHPAGDLSNIFRGGSQRSSTGTHYYKATLEAKETSPAPPTSPTSPSWSELKEKMEQADEVDTESPNPADFTKPTFKDPAEGANMPNRSMKNTTILQRDALDVEGFLRPVDEDDEDYSENKSSKSINWNFISSKSYLLGAVRTIQNFTPRAKKLSPFTKSLLMAWSIPVLFIALLFIWGQTLSNKHDLNPLEKALADTVALFTPPELLLPPANLVVNNLMAELRPDKSGEPMIVISGNIFNAGLQAVLNPTLEARTFDKNNSLVKSVQAPVPNELSRYASSVNLTEITKEEVLGLQNKRSWDGIAPGKPIPFKMVVTDIGQGYKYFSAKIYSVSEIS